MTKLTRGTVISGEGQAEHVHVVLDASCERVSLRSYGRECAFEEGLSTPVYHDVADLVDLLAAASEHLAERVKEVERSPGRVQVSVRDRAGLTVRNQDTPEGMELMVCTECIELRGFPDAGSAGLVLFDGDPFSLAGVIFCRDAWALAESALARLKDAVDGAPLEGDQSMHEPPKLAVMPPAVTMLDCDDDVDITRDQPN